MDKWIKRALDTRKAWVIITFLFLSAAAGSASAEGKTTVLLGSYRWDAEADGFASGETADFAWQHDGKGESYLRMINKAAAALVPPARAFDNVDFAYAKRLDFTKLTFSKKSLKPGTVIVFKTGQGHYGKMEIVGFRSSHDFDFGQALHLKKLQDYFKSRKERPHYHLEVRWELLSGPTAQQI
jgi:hypothetical protein